MPRGLSIRRYLALQVLLTGFVMLALSLVFVFSQQHTDRAEQRIFDHELAPATALREVERHLLSVQTRLQAELLGTESAVEEPERLAVEGARIRSGWETFKREHLSWVRGTEEARLIADLENELPALWHFLERAETASRNNNGDDLARLLRIDWAGLQPVLFRNLSELATLQEHHIGLARQELQISRHHSIVAVGSLLAAGMVLLGGFAIGLLRYVMRRIVMVENALDQVAAGAGAVGMPHRPGETEVARIADAIKRTAAHLNDSHESITVLMRRQQTILESLAEGLYGVDAEGRIMFSNPAGLAMLGYAEHEVLGLPAHALFHHHHADGRPYALADCPIAETRRTGRVSTRVGEVFFRKDGSSLPVEYTSAPLRDAEKSFGCVVVFHDITERLEQDRLLRDTITELQATNVRLGEAQGQLLQAEKLAGLGQLAAGVAHEINNPIAFIQSDIGAFEKYLQDIFTLIDGYETLIHRQSDGDLRGAATRLHDDADLDFVRNDLHTLIAESRDGLRRIARIVADLKDFSRVDDGREPAEADLVQGLESTLNVMHATIADKADVVRDYAPLPAVRCHAGQIHQVFVNLLLNAVHAIGHRGTITVSTRQSGDEVCIEIRDTGRGMEAHERQRMFDPFFTTKPVGEGTGLGLSVSYSIVRRHDGRFEVDSAPGRGTAVRVWLPIKGSASVED
ncbi:two-component system sensor histidine kinase NtrB [Aromatoleum toluclasticum]|uniref:two-component system sensor histidine kinase NtrB n=1 Tax=Aromatoleum toluclasticum TaxID=92003 RepID=UPI00035DE909|nr:ATP-binding protein [Aromatoleum toluclasticum]